jgi:hypothetical protein
MRYTIDVKVTGYASVEVDAVSLEVAEEAAANDVLANYSVSELRWKELTTTTLTSNEISGG